MSDDRTAPPGYARFVVGRNVVVALAALETTLRRALAEGTLFEYAAHHREARALRGRGIAYAVPLPDGETRVVVRRSRHGGILAPLTGERFLAPTRAPRELDIALRLHRQGVATPELIAYATHPAGALLRRADVLTREIPGAEDLAAALASADEARRRALLDATASLLATMARVGARHPDLNLKNIAIAPDANGAPEAYLLDVDRVWFDAPGARVAKANARRLERSSRKWRRTAGLPIDDGDLRWLAATVDQRAGIAP